MVEGVAESPFAGADPVEVGRHAAHLERVTGAEDEAQVDILGRAVRISAAEGFGTTILAPALPQLRAQRPGLRIELAANPGFLSPSRREVDMAVILSAPDNARVVVEPLTEQNYRSVLEPLIGAGDFLLNVSVEVSSAALVAFCRDQGALYLDTCIEPWPGGYTDPELSPSLRSNYALREKILEMRKQHPGGPTAVMTHGANPGLVSHFVKVALLDLAEELGVKVTPQTRPEWAALAAELGVKVIHIAERDTQVANTPKSRDEFVNTWSIDGFVGEGCQPA